MSRRRSQGRSSSGGGIGGLIAVLVIIALVIKFIWWILGAAALIGLFYLVRAIMREEHKRRDALARLCAEIAARADQQHQWVLQGDDRGIYGPDCAPLMHFIEDGGTQPAPTTGPPVTQPRNGPFGTRFVR